jgi:hypothetical protein
MDVTTRPLIWQFISTALATILGAVITIVAFRWNEKFRAKTADQYWERQWRQDQKLKIYTQILRAINDYAVWLSDVSDSRKFGDSGTNTMKKDCASIAEEFHTAYAVAPLFLIKSSLDVLEMAKPTFFYHSSPFEDRDVQEADRNIARLKEWRERLSASAIQDLERSPLHR